ncbi:MAG: ROK family protein [Actinomycetota bacterium]
MSGPGGGLFVGVDIGGTSVEAVVADTGNRVVRTGAAPTDATSGELVLASAINAIRYVMPGDADGIQGIGIGVPGQVDVETGVVRLAMNLNIGDGGFPIGRLIAREFGLHTTVENDVRAAAVGAYESLQSDHLALHVLAFLSIGTGISAGFVIDGRLHRGRDGMSGEIGHVVVADDGPECRCGLRGCLEAVAAGPAIRRMWAGGERRPAEDLFRAAAGGDPEAIRVAGVVSGYLARAVQWLALAYGADLVVLGGGVGAMGEPLLSAVRARLAGWGDRSPLARRLLPPERVVAMPAGFPTGAIGAAAVARNRLAGAGEEVVTRIHSTEEGSSMDDGPHAPKAVGPKGGSKW